jgi:hypothetical protein
VAWESTHTSPVTNPGIIQIGRFFISCYGWQACNYSLYLLSLSLSLTHTHVRTKEHMKAFTQTPTCTDITYLRPCTFIPAVVQKSHP